MSVAMLTMCRSKKTLHGQMSITSTSDTWNLRVITCGAAEVGAEGVTGTSSTYSDGSDTTVI